MRTRFGIALTAAVVAAATLSAQSDKLQGTTYRAPSGTTLRIMLDDSNVGPEVTLGEMIFPHNQDSGDHAHGAKEMFYVVSGELEHVVHGKRQLLTPGLSAFVNPPYKVRHTTGAAGAKVVVVWAPGDEGKKIASR